MLRSLWFKLSAVLILLTLISLMLIVHVFNILLIRQEYGNFVVPEKVEHIVQTTRPFFAEAVKSGSEKWQALAGEELRDRLINMKSSTGEFYIGTCSYPQLYYRVFSQDGSLFASYPESFPEQVAGDFAQRESLIENPASDTAELVREGHIWLSQSLLDTEGRARGRLEVLFVAEYTIRPFLEILARCYLEDWNIFLLCFTITGVACGLTANLFVTRSLKAMHSTTLLWCQGDLSPRIPVHKKANDILAEHSRILNAMADEIQSLLDLRYRAAVSEERNRVAKELHDTVKQNLFALKLQLAAIARKNQDKDIAIPIGEARQITHEAQDDIAGILTQLSLPISGGRGFYERLSIVSENMWRRHQLTTVWERKGAVLLSPAEEQTLLRIAQEAMANATRHGRATKIIMDISRQGSFVRWTLADNGCGLHESGQQKQSVRLGSGLGLVFMRERAQALPEGEFFINDAPTGGTVVEIRWRAA